MFRRVLSTLEIMNPFFYSPCTTKDEFDETEVRLTLVRCTMGRDRVFRHREVHCTLRA